MKKRKNLIQNNRGIAIITAILALAFLTYLATEVTYDATVEYAVHSQGLKKLKAYYAARSGVEISLLRVKAYQQVVKQLGDDAANLPMINLIWQFPLQWPLSLPTEDVNLSLSDQESLEDAKEGSLIDATFDTQISDEGSKIDLNDLVSPSKVLRENARRQLLNTFNQEMENNEKFAARYRNFRFEELINQIADFMSDKRESLNGGEKAAAFSSTEYQGYPPNRAFRTLSEMRILPLMDDQLFKILENRVTVFGVKGINPNTASREVLMSIDTSITEAVADQLIRRRENDAEGGPFKSPEDFWNAMQMYGGRPPANPAEIPIITDAIASFRIKSTGVYSNVRSQIEVVVMDLDSVSKRVADFVKKERQPPGGSGVPGGVTPGGNPPGGSGNNTGSASMGPPRILYWFEN